MQLLKTTRESERLFADLPFRRGFLRPPSTCGPFPPPELPGFTGSASLSAIPVGPACLLQVSRGKSERLGVGGPPVAGRVYPYILTLRPGSTSSMPLGFHRYWGPVRTPTTPVDPYILTLGSYRVGSKGTWYLGSGIYSIRVEFGGTRGESSFPGSIARTQTPKALVGPALSLQTS